MTTSSVSLFLGLLALGGLTAVFAALSAVLVDNVAPDGEPGSLAHELLVSLRRSGLRIALLTGCVAMAGSLYYSEGAGFDPCQLCWAQRAFMYPSVVVLLVAQWRPLFGWLAVGLSTVGFAVAVYHRLEQQYPDTIGATCDPINPCSGRWVNTFGFLTIPTMAAIAFAMITVFGLLALWPAKSAASRSTPADLKTAIGGTP